MKFEHLQGSIVAMITPFHEDGSVNFEVLTQLLERQIAAGTDAILTGTRPFTTRMVCSTTEASKGSLRMVGNHPKSIKAEGSLTARQTCRADTKVGLSDPAVEYGIAVA